MVGVNASSQGEPGQFEVNADPQRGSRNVFVTLKESRFEEQAPIL